MNKLKTFILMLVLSMMLLVIGGVIGGQAGVIVALVIALAMNIGAYWFTNRIALGMTKPQPITEQDNPELFGIVREQARRAAPGRCQAPTKFTPSRPMPLPRAAAQGTLPWQLPLASAAS